MIRACKRAGELWLRQVIVLDVANPFFTDVARGVEDEASKSGLAVILCNSDDQLPKEAGYLALLPAGLIVIETPALSVSAGRAVGASIAATDAATRPTAVFCANDPVALACSRR